MNSSNGLKSRIGISAAVLKWIAVISMIIDHFGIAVYRQLSECDYRTYMTLRDIGRIAFPIYCFLLVEGYFHTKNLKKYIGNCLIFALLSEIPFNMAVFGEVFYIKGQNVFFTLTLGLMAMYAINNVERAASKSRLVSIMLQALSIVLFCTLGELLEVDYHWRGVAYILMFYYLKRYEAYFGKIAGAFIASAAFALYEPPAVLAFLPIAFYDGTRGRQRKYLFYLIYPLHLLLFGIIRPYAQELTAVIIMTGG